MTTFTIVVAHTRDGHSVDEIAFLMQISPSLVQAYQQLYQQYDVPEYQERLDEIVAMVKARDYRPDHLVDDGELEKGGNRR